MICNGVKPNKVYQEIASGINDERPVLNQLIKDISDKKIKKLYVTYKDRLTRFGFNYFKTFCAVNNTELFVIDELESSDKSAQQELAEDLIGIIHHYSVKLDSNIRKQMKEIANMLKTNSD